ncbi:MAG: hypothetical protein OEQ74_07810, partial [Gammaproteobacteria bacterium]|nr:hypothetical protein [Gammaproteobacteria bacterium]
MKTKCVMGLALLLLSHTVSASDFGIGDLAYHSLPLTGDAVYLDLVGTDQIVFPLHADSDLQGLYSQTVNPQGQ